MILISDIGNTNITIGLFEKGKKIEIIRLDTDCSLTSQDYGLILSYKLSGFEIEGAIVSSVVDELTDIYAEAIEKYLKIKPFIFSYKTDVGLKILTDEKSELGADRIVNAVAAIKFYKPPAIVVDLGTATTFDIINGKNEYVGGLIAPGLKIQMRALSQFTSKLPLVEIDNSKAAIAKNTKDAILSGVIRGHAHLISGLLKDCEQEMDEKPITIATGGYARMISKYLEKPFDFIDNDLTLKGLLAIYNILN